MTDPATALFPLASQDTYLFLYTFISLRTDFNLPVASECHREDHIRSYDLRCKTVPCQTILYFMIIQI